MANVINPSHYKKGRIELIDFLEDLEKASWYLQKLITTRKKTK